MRRLTLALLLTLWPMPALAQGTTQWTVLPHLPGERRAEMTAALRLELAGRATLLEPEAAFDPEITTAALRERAAAAGATHVVWISFPGGVLAPAEVRVLDLARSDAAHGMTPQAWDVVEPRVVAVLVGSLMDAAAAPPALPSEVIDPAPPTEPAPPPPTPVEAAPPEEEPPAAPADTRAARRYSIGFLTGWSYRSVPDLSNYDSFSTTVSFYGRASEWLSLGVRLQITGIGVSTYVASDGTSSTEVGVNGVVGAPSLMVSFREPLGTVAMLELGVHAEPGLYFYARSISQWSFGLGVGAFANLDLGVHNAITLDFTVSAFGFGEVGAQFWGALSLGYTYRWD